MDIEIRDIVSGILVATGIGAFITKTRGQSSRIKTLENKLTDKHGLPILVSAPDCIKSQNSCRELLGNKISNLTTLLESRDKHIEVHLQRIYSKIDAISK